MPKTKIFWLFCIYIILCPAYQKSVSPAGLCITFDDRTIEAWYGLRPILQKYNVKATFFVTQFDSLTATEIDMLKVLEQEGHEIASHGALHVLSEYYIKEHSYRAYYENEILANLATMSQKGFKVSSFAYPYGAKYWFTDALILRKFDFVRGVAAYDSTMDINTLDAVFCKFGSANTCDALGIDANSRVDITVIEKAFKRCLSQKEVLMLVAHHPVSVPKLGDYEVDLVLLEEIFKKAAQMKLKFFRVKDLT